MGKGTPLPPCFRLWPRCLALFIDFLLFCAVFFPVTRLVKGVWIMDASDHAYRLGWFVTDPLCLVQRGQVYIVSVILRFPRTR